MKARSARRHHADRVKAEVRRRIKTTWGDRRRPLADDPRFVGKAAAAPQVCSGICCGNARRYKGPTRREILATPGE
jgi:hypothetical protein